MTLSNDPQPSFRVGPLFLDAHLREARMGGVIVELTGVEFEVLLQLAARKGGVILREEFTPWNRAPAKWNRHPVDDVIKELRRKLPRKFIATARGRGYHLASGVPVTEVDGPSVSQAERLKAIALDRMNVFTLPALRTAVQRYEEVLRHGPDADAYACLAINYINQGHSGFCLDFPQRSVQRARAVLQEALVHYPKFSSAYAIYGLTRATYDRDWTGAEKDLARAFELNADDEYAHLIQAHFDIARGRFDDGIAHARRAADLDWRSPMTVFTLPWMLGFAKRTEEALAESERALIDFGPFAVGHMMSGYVWEVAGDESTAIKEFKRSLEIAESPGAYGSLGYAYGKQGDTKSALACLNKLRNLKSAVYVSAWNEALVFLGLGKKEEALQCLERAFDQRCDWLIHLNVDIRWDLVREEPRFRQVVARMGLPRN